MIYYDHLDHELIVIRIGRINEIVEQWEWLWWRRNEWLFTELVMLDNDNDGVTGDDGDDDDNDGDDDVDY